MLDIVSIMSSALNFRHNIFSPMVIIQIVLSSADCNTREVRLELFYKLEKLVRLDGKFES